MPFTIEREKQDRMSFFDVQITRKYKAITTCVYLKSNFSGIYTHLEAFYHLPTSLGHTRFYMIANLLMLD